MNTLIVYAGKTGTSRECARKLAEQIGGADVFDISKTEPNLDAHKTVIVGGSIRMGKVSRHLKKFLLKNHQTLLEKDLALFLCCAFCEQGNRYFEANFTKALIDHAFSKECFGGQMDIDKLKGFDKLVAKMAAKQAQQQPEIIEKAIAKMARKVKEKEAR